MSTNPAGILNIDRGSLKKGGVADIVIIDPAKKWVYRKEEIKSKSRNSPFIGWTLKGAATAVIVGGKTIEER